MEHGVSAAYAGLPRFGVVRDALCTVTERLVREVVNPTSQAPAWNEFEWGVAKAVCALQGIAALLATRLQWDVPSGFRAFLDSQLAHGIERHAIADALLATLDDSFGQRKIPAVALKGSALRTLGMYQPGERPMGDVDLLVRPDDTAVCAEIMRSVGYEPLFSVRRHAVFAPVGRKQVHGFAEDRDTPLKIEIHTHIYEELPLRRMDITSEIWPDAVRPGLNPYASAASRLRHVMLHAAGGMRVNALRFIQVHDIAWLAAHMSVSDWSELLGDGSAGERPWWIFPPLSFAARYVPGSVPEEVLARARAECPRWLRARYEHRALHDVSWSNLRIAAFPGIEWCRSPLEAIRFVRTRVLPGREARDELAANSASNPNLTQVPWYGVSHAERIVRWLFTRPPRVQTIFAVSAALRADAASSG
jgi:hypothetical protein